VALIPKSVRISAELYSRIQKLVETVNSREETQVRMDWTDSHVLREAVVLGVAELERKFATPEVGTPEHSQWLLDQL